MKLIDAIKIVIVFLLATASVSAADEKSDSEFDLLKYIEKETEGKVTIEGDTAGIVVDTDNPRTIRNEQGGPTIEDITVFPSGTVIKKNNNNGFIIKLPGGKETNIQSDDDNARIRYENGYIILDSGEEKAQLRSSQFTSANVDIHRIFRLESEGYLVPAKLDGSDIIVDEKNNIHLEKGSIVMMKNKNSNKWIPVEIDEKTIIQQQGNGFRISGVFRTHFSIQSDKGNEVIVSVPASAFGETEGEKISLDYETGAKKCEESPCVNINNNKIYVKGKTSVYLDDRKNKNKVVARGQFDNIVFTVSTERVEVLKPSKELLDEIAKEVELKLGDTKNKKPGLISYALNNIQEKLNELKEQKKEYSMEYRALQSEKERLKKKQEELKTEYEADLVTTMNIVDSHMLISTIYKDAYKNKFGIEPHKINFFGVNEPSKKAKDYKYTFGVEGNKQAQWKIEGLIFEKKNVFATDIDYEIEMKPRFEFKNNQVVGINSLITSDLSIGRANIPGPQIEIADDKITISQLIGGNINLGESKRKDITELIQEEIAMANVYALTIEEELEKKGQDNIVTKAIEQLNYMLGSDILETVKEQLITASKKIETEIMAFGMKSYGGWNYAGFDLEITPSKDGKNADIELKLKKGREIEKKDPDGIMENVLNSVGQAKETIIRDIPIIKITVPLEIKNPETGETETIKPGEELKDRLEELRKIKSMYELADEVLD